jgi:hypothetical protein
MHHVNDDMDEIFRRAGKEYPLDTTGADWEKIAKELNISMQEKAVSKNSNRKFLWLLLLLPFSFICTQYFADNGSPETENSGSDKQTLNTSVHKNEVPKVSTNKFQQSIDQTSKKDISLSSENIKTGSERALPAQNLKTPFKITSTKAFQDKKQRLGKSKVATNEPAQDETISTLSRYQQFHLTTKQYSSFDISPKWAKHRNIADQSSSKRKGQENKKDKRFYAGLMGGIDATTIKFQKIENAGYDLGVLLGYKFNKKWSIETGLFRDKKFYYSEGEYFNTSKIYMPPNSEISSVEGNCIMWEIPVSVRYNFKASDKHTWFATGGVSSYFMKKENYSYDYYYPTTGQSSYYDHSYESSSKHLFAVIQISGGYTHRLGKAVDLRIEPYVKIPVRGVGIGSMPFQSAGVHIGITKEIF